jgi:hypothetical protein
MNDYELIKDLQSDYLDEQLYVFIKFYDQLELNEYALDDSDNYSFKKSEDLRKVIINYLMELIDKVDISNKKERKKNLKQMFTEPNKDFLIELNRDYLDKEIFSFENFDGGDLEYYVFNDINFDCDIKLYSEIKKFCAEVHPDKQLNLIEKYISSFKFGNKSFKLEEHSYKNKLLN